MEHARANHSLKAQPFHMQGTEPVLHLDRYRNGLHPPSRRNHTTVPAILATGECWMQLAMEHTPMTENTTPVGDAQHLARSPVAVEAHNTTRAMAIYA